MTSRSRSRRAARLGGALLLVAAAPAFAQSGASDGVVDLTLPVQDLSLRTASLDNSVDTLESNERVEVTLAADVLFAFDRAALTRRAQSRIAQAVEKIDENEPPFVQVTGYTDSKGADGYNRALSRRRAAAVAGALQDELGADAPSLRTRGRGEADPVAANTKQDGSDNPRGRARNRRVEIVFPK